MRYLQNNNDSTIECMRDLLEMNQMLFNALVELKERFSHLQNERFNNKRYSETHIVDNAQFEQEEEEEIVDLSEVV